MSGLVPTRQAPADAVALVDADEQTPSAVWGAVATADGFQDALVDGVRELLAGTHHSDHQRVLEEAGVTAAEGMYAAVLAALDRPREDVSPAEYADRVADPSAPGYHALDRHAEALRVTAGFGAPEPTILGHLSLEDLADGPLAVLDATDRVPTVAARVDEAFRERDRDQRETTLRLLATLGQTCEVRVVCTSYTARWLAHHHRDTLPSSFSERATARGDNAPPIDDLVAAARDTLDVEGRAVSVLRDLAAEPGETLSYGALVSRATVSKARISQVLGELEALQLAERFGKRDAKRVELLPAGSTLLDTLDAERGRQAELDAAFSETGQDTTQCRVPRGQAREGEEALPDRGRTADPYRTRYLPQPAHHATAAVASTGGLTAIEAPFDHGDERIRWVSYDDDRDEAVIAVRATTPLQYIVSTALSLASPQLFDQALPVSRLERIDDPSTILRDARCIGCLSAEAVDDAQVLRDDLVAWGETLAEMTTDLSAGEYEDRDRFRGEIMRVAHGLAGTVVHLLDVAGVDLVRELRVPSGLSHDRLADLAETVSIATAIQSRYGAFAVYRQVYETRVEKRQSALAPDVDAADPYGEYIGGIVLRGPSALRLARHVEGTLPNALPVHEESPEIAVRLPVTTPDRTAHAETVARMCSVKNLEPTREAVTLFRALVPSPYAVAEALNWLGSEEYLSRGLRLDEIRLAVSCLDPRQILPNTAPTVSKAVAALLRSATPLTQTELADAADVSTRSLRRHLETLEAFDLVRHVDGGYRFALPFNDSEADERGAWILPDPVDEARSAAQDLLYELVEAFVDDPCRFGDASDPVCGVFMEYPYDWGRLRTALPAIDPWIRVAKALCDDPEPEPTTVQFGSPTPQASLTTPTDTTQVTAS